MRKPILLLPILLAASILTGTVYSSERVGDFSLLDHEGYFHNMRWYDDHAAVALLVQSSDSHDDDEVLPAYMALRDRYADQGIEFMMINPMGRLNRDTVAEQMQAGNVEMPVLMDDTRLISRLWNPADRRSGLV